MNNRLNMFVLAVVYAGAAAGAPAVLAQRQETTPRNDRLTLETFLQTETVTDPQPSSDGTRSSTRAAGSTR